MNDKVAELLKAILIAFAAFLTISLLILFSTFNPLTFNLFKASPSDIREGNTKIEKIFTSLDLKPEKVESDGSYHYEGGGLTFTVHFSEEMIQSHPVLKESPKRTNNRIEVYVVQLEDISYAEVGENLLNTGLYQFLEETYNLIIDSTKDRIYAKSADFLEARVLDVEPKTALLVIRRISYYQDKPVSIDHVRIIGSQYEAEISGKGRSK